MLEMINKIKIKNIFLVAALLRLISLPWTFHGDIKATYWWGKFALDFGWRGFYDWLNFGGYGRPDQPMVNIYYDWLVRIVYQIIYQLLWFLNTQIPAFPSNLITWYVESGNLVLLKIPMLLADLLLIYFAYRYSKKFFDEKKSKIIVLILALYPPFIYNTSFWGSGDSIVNLLAIISLIFIWQKRYIFSAFFLIISILYKPSLLIWAPIYLVIALKHKIGLKNITHVSLFSIGLIYLISYPFAPKEINPILWFTNTMTSRILPGFMPHLTANAMNFWGLIYGLELKLDSLFLFNFITARTLSILICIPFYIYTLVKFHRHFTLKNLLFTTTSFTLITFTFMTRMHERYTYPALLPLLLLAFHDKKLMKYFIYLSVTHTYNVLCAWWLDGLLYFYPLVAITSITNILLTLKIVFWNPTENSKSLKQ